MSLKILHTSDWHLGKIFKELDEGLLDSICDILVELPFQDRLAGLISHLEELKNFIPTHIYVYKDKRGVSKIRYSIL